MPPIRLPATCRAAFLAASAFLATLGSAQAAPVVELVSGYDFEPGDAANGNSSSASLSPDGRYLAFTTEASNLVAGFSDRNHASDALLLDRQTGELDYVSRAFGAPSQAAERSSQAIAVSGNGRWVLFSSLAHDLVPGAVLPGGADDPQLYLFDRTVRDVQLVSHVPGQPLLAANDFAIGIRLTDDGRFALFETRADNMAGGSEHDNRVFLYDRLSGETRLISHVAGAPAMPSAGSAAAVDLSADGSLVLFTSTGSDHVAGLTDTAGSQDVFLYDRNTGAAQLISHQAGAPLTAVGALAKDLTPDGRFVLVEAPNVAMGAGLTDGNSALQRDVFIYDRQSGLATLASKSVNVAGRSAEAGSIGLRISDDGNTLYFLSPAINLILPFSDNNGFGVRDLYRFDRALGEVSLASGSEGSAVRGANALVAAVDSPQAISPDGRYFLFATMGTDLQLGVTDSNAAIDIYLFDRNTRASTLVSRRGTSLIAGSGVARTALLGPDGDVIFASDQPLDPSAGDPAIQLDVFAFDRSAARVGLETKTDQTGSATFGGVGTGSLTPDGRFATFLAYLRDNRDGTLEKMGHRADVPATPSNAPVTISALSPDGRYVSLTSQATNLVNGVTDTNRATDVFLYDRETDSARLVSHAAVNPNRAAANGSSSGLPAMAPDGSQLFFLSSTETLVAGQSGISSFAKLFFYDFAVQQSSLISHAHDAVATCAAPGASALRDVSADRRYVVFASSGHNLIPGFVDRNDFTPADHGAAGEPGPEGSSPVYVDDLYFYDRDTRTATLISHRPGLPNEGALEEEPQRAILAADAAAVYYTSARRTATEQGSPRTYRWDRASNSSSLITQIGGGPLAPCGDHASLADMTADGRLLLITSLCAFTPGDSNGAEDVYLVDRGAGQIRLISHQPGFPAIATGGTADDLSADGRRIVFRSTDGVPHSYHRTSQRATRLTSAHDDPDRPVPARFADASADGLRVLVVTSDPSLSPVDANGADDLFLVTLEMLLFSDGFESGSTAGWSLTLP